MAAKIIKMVGEGTNHGHPFDMKRFCFFTPNLIMKKLLSLLACCIIILVLVQYRISYSDLCSKDKLKVTTWDALGYYMYLPAIFVYHDMTELKWFPAIDKKYAVSGGWVYQHN